MWALGEKQQIAEVRVDASLRSTALEMRAHRGLVASVDGVVSLAVNLQKLSSEET